MEFLKKLIRAFDETKGSTTRTKQAEPEIVYPNIDGYRVLRLLGQGTTSSVYLAQTTSNPNSNNACGEPVAMKIANPNAENKSLIMERFFREAALAKKLSIPSVVRSLATGETAAGEPYHVMEFVPGLDLAKLNLTERILPDGRVREIMIGLCDALGGLHSHGIIHRDVKPSNVMLFQSLELGESIKLVDLGLADELPRCSDRKANVLSGTPHYSAPEVWQNPNEFDFRSDIYSLGCCAYHLLSGNPPFAGRNALQICSKHIRAAPVDLLQLNEFVSRPFAELIMRCLSKNVEQRASSMQDLQAELVGILPFRAWKKTDAQTWWTDYSAKYSRF